MKNELVTLRSNSFLWKHLIRQSVAVELEGPLHQSRWYPGHKTELQS